MQLSPLPPQRQATIVIPSDVPVYKIKEGTFFGPDDCLYEEGSIIEYDDEPAMNMEPMNALAEKSMRDYLAKLDALGKAVAEKTGKSYISYSDAFENARTLGQQESNKVRLISGQEIVPLMKANKSTSNSKVRKVGAKDDSAPLGKNKGKLAVGNRGNRSPQTSNETPALTPRGAVNATTGADIKNG